MSQRRNQKGNKLSKFKEDKNCHKKESKYILYIDKRFNPSKNKLQIIHIWQCSLKIYQTKPDITEGKNKQFYNNNWRPQYPTYRTRQKSNKEIEDANDPIQQLDLTYISTEEYTLFSSANMEHSIW